MSLVIDYDDGTYSYQDYWRGRVYEHRAELLALRSLLQQRHTGWMADLGCGFGRLTPAYLDQGRPVVFVDYSLKLLEQAMDRCGPPVEGRQYVAANLNYLPFRPASITTALLIRVMHHLPSYDRVLREVSRVAQDEWIIDIPQKRHARAQLRGLSRGQWRTLRESAPINLSRQPPAIFLNYQADVIVYRLAQLDWSVRRMLSVSNLRSAWLKDHVSADRLVALEGYLQPRLASIRFGPNLWYALSRGFSTRQPDWDNLIACPQCLGQLQLLDSANLVCATCRHRFSYHNGIWDLRWPRPRLPG